MKSFVIVTGLLCATAAIAQEAPLAPGAALLQPARVRLSTDSFQIDNYREGKLWRSGKMVRRITRSADTLVFAQTYFTPEGTTVDTSWVNARTLAPIRYFAEVYGEKQTFRFDGKSASGTVAPKDSASRPVSIESQVPIFNAVALDLIYNALPLAPGFTTDVPMYNPPRMLMTPKLRVVGEEKLEKAKGGFIDAWVLEYQMGPLTQKLWLDRKTGEFLRISAVRDGNAFHKYRLDLKPPVFQTQ